MYGVKLDKSLKSIKLRDKNDEEIDLETTIIKGLGNLVVKHMNCYMRYFRNTLEDYNRLNFSQPYEAYQCFGLTPGFEIKVLTTGFMTLEFTKGTHLPDCAFEFVSSLIDYKPSNPNNAELFKTLT